jgi:integrase
VEGRRRQKVLYGRTKREVLEKLRAALQEQATGTLRVGRAPSIAELLTSWLDASRSSVRPSTFTSYEWIVRVHLVPTLGRVRLDRLTPADVEAMLALKAAEGLSARSCHHLRAVLRTALAKAVRWGLTSRNVAALADPPRVKRQESTVLDVESAQRFLEAVKGDRLEALYTVALALGLRQGEALGLRWRDVDLVKRSLTVRWALQRVRSAPSEPLRAVLVEPKTNRSRRTIWLPRVVMKAMQEHRHRQAEDRLLAGSAWVENGLVFTGRTGQPLLNTYVTRLFQGHLERAGLARMRFHELRHSAASLLIAQGVEARVVMEVLGHSTITITMDTYGHLFDSSRQAAADAMDRALGVNARSTD